MTDPRLNSVHLESPRRQVFRQARDMLLSARGMQTVAAENLEAAAPPSSSPHTMVLHAESQPPPGLRFWLVDREFLYPLKVGLNTIGRAPENDVVIQDAYVSRRHCAILVHAGDSCELHDIASKNGTFVNGRKLAGPTPLAAGDEIRMCDRQFVFMTRSGDEDSSGGFARTQTE
jgi:hypothetical protein